MTQVEVMFQRYGPKYRWLVTITVLLGLVALGMSITIVDVATPYIQGAFGMSASQVQWLSTGFLAATTVTLLIAPWMINAYGQRATYVALLVTFIVASCIGGVAAGMGAIIVSRVVQGAMTGLIRPVALEALFSVYPPDKRGMATAMYGMSLGLPLTLATVVGGWLIEHFTWRYVFFVTMPICAAAIIMGLLFLPPREESGPRPRLDWVGVVVLFVSIFTILAALANGQRWGWNNDRILDLEGFSALTGVFFIWWERRHPRPLLDLAIFKSKEFLAGCIALLLFGGVFYAVMYLLPQFMEQILHYSPVTSGMIFLPSTLVLAVLVPLVGRVSDRAPPHWLTLPSLVCAIWGVYRMAHADWDTSFTSLAESMALLSIAMAGVAPPTISSSISALPAKLIGYGSGTINFALQLGGAFGTVTLVALLDRRTLLHSTRLTAGLNPANPMAREALSRIGHVLAHTGVSSVYRSEAARHVLGGIDKLWAVIYAYQDGFLLVVLALVITCIPSYFLSRWTTQKKSATSK